MTTGSFIINFCKSNTSRVKEEGNIVPLHAMEALWGRGDIAPNLS
jgi:hypothetical protein